MSALTALPAASAALVASIHAAAEALDRTATGDLDAALTRLEESARAARSRMSLAVDTMETIVRRVADTASGLAVSIYVELTPQPPALNGAVSDDWQPTVSLPPVRDLAADPEFAAGLRSRLAKEEPHRNGDADVRTPDDELDTTEVNDVPEEVERNRAHVHTATCYDREDDGFTALACGYPAYPNGIATEEETALADAEHAIAEGDKDPDYAPVPPPRKRRRKGK